MFWLGTAGIAAEVLVVQLAIARHRLAPAAAAGIGGVPSLGYTVVHFLPNLGWFSDSFVSGDHVGPLSWEAAKASWSWRP